VGVGFYSQHGITTVHITAAILQYKARKTEKNCKVNSPNHKADMGGTDLCFLSPQPDTSLHCETTDMGLVHDGVCLLVQSTQFIKSGHHRWHV